MVACPSCDARVAWSESSRWRPFCSSRCQVIDLGGWASNRYVIGGVGPGRGASPLDEAGTDASAELGSRQ
jgi:endogenous inhibitor of DNA gyrase (YacG/DUF329 family)